MKAIDIFHNIEISKNKFIKVIKPNIKSVGPVTFNKIKNLYVFRIDDLYLAYKKEKEADRIHQNLLIDIKEYFTKIIEGEVKLYEQFKNNFYNSEKIDKPHVIMELAETSDSPDDENIEISAELDIEKVGDIKIENAGYRAYMKGYNKCYNCKGDMDKKKNPFEEDTELYSRWEDGWNGRRNRIKDKKEN